MLFQSITLAVLASAGMIEARSAGRRMNIHERATATTGDDTSLTLAQDAIASGSFSDGLTEIGGNEAFEAASATSQNNFINFCEGETLTNGLQIVTGSCNGIPMGQIPAKTKMMSSIITFPLAGSATIESDTTFNITVQMSNITPGSFSNADSTYFSAPQQLDASGVVIGHTHVTVQDMGSSLNPTGALDPTQFAFFKGINDAGNGQGLLSATVSGGLPAGNYRVCTLASSTNHQPVIMPVAQRGTADDCTKFTVVGTGTTANAASNNGSGGQAAAALAASAVAAGPDNKNPVVSSSLSDASSLSSAKSSVIDLATTTSASKTSAKFTSASVDTSSAVQTKSSSKNNQGGTVSVIEIVTFFDFKSGLGGLPPPVAAKGDSFVVLEELFEELADAAKAACGHQFEACVSFEDASFSETECSVQSVSCASAANTATSTPASPSTLTATQTVPPVSRTSSAVAAIVTSVSSSSSAGKTKSTKHSSAKSSAITSDTSPASECAPQVTQFMTVFADAVVVTSTTSSSVASSIPTLASSSAPFSNSTAKSATASSSSALGGITAPPVTNSGDSSRPFLVNGNTFVNEAAALQRSCDIQFNACANAFNGGTADGFDLSDCQTQENACLDG
ncbi:hypothetical protein NHQ30_009763 [Ciborinia camelliae]|nr:hypothetical protein NHQ30_009763 [Ciborinia camelliae]